MSAGAKLWAGAAMLAAFSCLSDADAATPSRVAPQPLTALDRRSISPGLGCDFSAHGQLLMLVTDEKAIVKPGGRLLGFRFDQNRGLALINYGGNFGDSAVRVLIDRDEEPFRHGEEAASSHARLTIRGFGQETTVTGTWTCGA